MSDVIIWSDFDRINETHFWSMDRNILIAPEVETGLGRRNGVKLSINIYRLFLVKSNHISGKIVRLNVVLFLISSAWLTDPSKPIIFRNV